MCVKLHSFEYFMVTVFISTILHQCKIYFQLIYLQEYSLSFHPRSTKLISHVYKSYLMKPQMKPLLLAEVFLISEINMDGKMKILI